MESKRFSLKAEILWTQVFKASNQALSTRGNVSQILIQVILRSLAEKVLMFLKYILDRIP